MKNLCLELNFYDAVASKLQNNKNMQMESDEKYIESRFGKKTPFRVPDGYFDNIAKSVMAAAMPDEAVSASAKHEPAATPGVRLSLWRRLRRYVAVAACAAFAVAGVATYLAVADGDEPVAAHAQRHQRVATCSDSQSASQMSSSTYDAEMDYTMLDNDDIYSLVASN